MIVEELIAILGFKMTGGGEASAFQKKLQDVRKTVSAVAATATLAGAAIVAGFAKSAVTASAEWEKLGTTLETIEGSPEKARKSLDWVGEFAAKTPYELQEVADAFVKMRAYGLDPMDGSLQALGNASSAMGKSFNAAVEAMADATTGENERLKEFGITSEKVGDQITYTWRQDGKKMTKTVKKDAGEISKALTNIFEGRFPGAMDKQSRTFNGMMSNLKDQYQGFLRMIGDAGMFDFAKDSLRGLLTEIEKLKADGTLKTWATNISNMAIGAAQSIGRIVEMFKNIFTWIGKSDAAVAALGIAIGGLVAFFAPVLASAAALYLALDDLAAWARGDASVIGEVINVIGEAWRLFLADVNTVKTAIVNFWTEFTTRLSNAATGIGTFAANFVSVIANALVELLAKVAAWVVSFKDYFNIDLTAAGTAIINSLLDGIKAGAQAVLDYLGGLKDKIVGFFSGATVQGPSISMPNVQGGSPAGNAAPPRSSPSGAGRTGPAPSAGQSSPDNPGLKRGASLFRPTDGFNGAMARTNVASLAGGVRGAGGNVVTDNSRTEISVKVDKTNASPQDIANAVKTAQAESKMSNVFFTSASPATA